MDAVVLDLARLKNKVGGAAVTWEMLYVAISRAPSDNQLRMLPLNKNQSVRHLLQKKPAPPTLEYLDERFWVDPSGKRRFQDGGGAAQAAVAQAPAPAQKKSGKPAAEPAPKRRPRAQYE